MHMGIRTNLCSRSFSDGKLKEIREYGFTAAELSFNYEPDELPWNDVARGHAIRAQAEALGLFLTAHLPDTIHIAMPEAAASEPHVERLLAILAGVREYGPTLAVLHAEATPLALSSTEEMRMAQSATFRANLAKIAPICECLGIRLLIETMTPGYGLTASFSEIITAVSEIASPGLGVCIDTNHLNLSENLPVAISRAGNLLGELHGSDNLGKTENHLMLYDGIIAWDMVAHALIQNSYDGPFILETVHYDNTRYASRMEAATDAASRFLRELNMARKHSS